MYLFIALKRSDTMEKVRVSLAKNIVDKKITMEAGTEGWAITDKPVYKRKKQQSHMVHVIFDDGKEIDLPWSYLMRRVDDDEDNGVVIRYAKKT